MRVNPGPGWLLNKRIRRQSGQALVYGLFMLIAGLAALFFLFNVSQLTREKSKLVNTSDAVAYSAAVMQTRALNFAAYTNRALVAGEVSVAQSVSLASWGKYLVEHGRNAVSLGCSPGSTTSEPAVAQLQVYLPVCNYLASSSQTGALTSINDAIQRTGQQAVIASEISKHMLRDAQRLVLVNLPVARYSVMLDVANKNYLGDGAIEVDRIPLRDTFSAFNGRPIAPTYSGDLRGRMRELVIQVVSKDGFTPQRFWRDRAQRPDPSCASLGDFRSDFVKGGDGKLNGFDLWRSTDEANYLRWQLQKPSPSSAGNCAQSVQLLARSSQTAGPSGNTSNGSANWAYSGIPSYADLSADALQDPDPRAQFAVRLLRQASQTRTSDARSEIKTTPRLNAYTSAVPTESQTQQKVYVGLSAAESFFARPVARDDGNTELASLFNPYWQTRLLEVPDHVRALARAMWCTPA